MTLKSRCAVPRNGAARFAGYRAGVPHPEEHLKFSAEHTNQFEPTLGPVCSRDRPGRLSLLKSCQELHRTQPVDPGTDHALKLGILLSNAEDAVLHFQGET